MSNFHCVRVGAAKGATDDDCFEACILSVDAVRSSAIFVSVPTVGPTCPLLFNPHANSKPPSVRKAEWALPPDACTIFTFGPLRACTCKKMFSKEVTNLHNYVSE